MKKNIKKLTAFTLAEVLITLAIIGVVAAITVPVLSGTHKKAEVSAKVKKYYMNMTNAVEMAEAVTATSAFNWKYYGTETAQAGENFFNAYIGPYLKYSNLRECSGDECKDKGFGDYKYTHVVTFDDGSQMWFKMGTCFDNVVDINGAKAPNKKGRDRFSFMICPKNSFDMDSFDAWHLYIDENGTRKYLLDSCGGSEPDYCSTLLKYDGWEVKKDYPVKL